MRTSAAAGRAEVALTWEKAEGRRCELWMRGGTVKENEYVIVTPARNEEAYLAKTIEAVVSQTVLPQKWVIVVNGSVDRTDEIAAEHARRHSFIQFLKLDETAKSGERDFGSKVRAFRAGYEQLNCTQHQFVGNLDADVTFAPSYFAEILERFKGDPQLGLAGGIVCEPDKRGFQYQRISLNSVCGAVQLFRRECYEEIGGYVPIRTGGVDAAAEIFARMHGWKVRTIPDVPVYAQRRVLTGGATILHTMYRQGASHYMLGYHPLFQLASCLRRIAQSPFLLGSICALLGYGSPWLRRQERILPSEAIRFLRLEQMSRLSLCLQPWREAEK
jgi:poly-beta-1,6-N-acetyl-D-glucosamine synthase